VFSACGRAKEYQIVRQAAEEPAVLPHVFYFIGGNLPMEQQSFLATEKLGKLMQKYAIPCIISLLVGALYNIVKRNTIGNAGGSKKL
jgi:hypothetical protein